jgi:hypothetical protein
MSLDRVDAKGWTAIARCRLWFGWGHHETAVVILAQHV